MISVQELTKTFGTATVLEQLHATVPTGSIYGLVGSNGAGKSTLLRLLAGVYRADGGAITVDGQPVYENPAVKGSVAFVPDQPYFLPGADLRRMAKLYRAAYADFDETRFWQLAKQFELAPGARPHALSTGRCRQAAIALSLARRARVFLFDESFDGLDPVVRRLTKRLICEKVAEEQTTVVVTSHSLRELEDLCDRLALLHRGTLVLEGDLQELRGSLFKVRAAFDGLYDRSLFAGLDVLAFDKQGALCTLTLQGDRAAVMAELQQMHPLLLEAMPLTLEEVFELKMRQIGYAFDERGEVI